MSSFRIENFPFDLGYVTENGPHLREGLPFVLRCDPGTELISQDLTPEVRNRLKRYYEKGGYGSTPLGEGDFATHQAEQVLEELAACLRDTKKELRSLSTVEIGASYGYLLHCLRDRGAKSVIGVEPGEEGIVGGKKYGVTMVHDFFPTSKLKGVFDLLLSHCVLEHIEQPLPFAQEMVRRLRSDGVLFLAVPDCEKKLAVGDVSIISHQHVNYFTSLSLLRLLEAAGLEDVRVSASPRRSMLYAWGRRSVEDRVAPSGDSAAGDETIFRKFENHFAKNLTDIQTIVDRAESEGKTIGLYASSPVLRGMLRFREEPRLFDGDRAKHGKWMSGSNRRVESTEDLVAYPVDVLFVCAIDYDMEIRQALPAIRFNDERMRIVSLKALYEVNSGMQYVVGSVA